MMSHTLTHQANCGALRRRVGDNPANCGGFRRRVGDILTPGVHSTYSQRPEHSLADLVLYLVRNCRRGGFGLVRSQTITYEEMKTAIATLLDEMVEETGIAVSEADRTLLVEQIPIYALHIDVMYPRESISGVFWGATRQLQDTLINFKEELNVAALEKNEVFLEFLSGLDVDFHQAAELDRFKKQFLEVRDSYLAYQRSQMTWIDHLLKKLQAWRHARLVKQSKTTKDTNRG